MSGLTEFLLARIAEDEAVARAATPGRWTYRGLDGYGSVSVTEPYTPVVTEGLEGDGGVSDEDGEHIARHNPARVLAECEAKRRIVEEAIKCDDQHGGGDTVEWARIGGEADAWDTALRLLALPYADHADYDEAWRP